MADATVAQHHEAIADRGGVGIVRDHHDRLPELVDRVAQQLAAPLRSTSSRGCRWARRRTRPPGRVTSARAIATRCCWPPDSSEGRCLRRSVRPTVSIRLSTHAWSMSRPAIVSGSVMFSSAVSTGSRLKAWKMKPIFSRRSSVSALVVERRDLDAVDLDRSRRGPVESGEAVHQGRLAGPGRSHDRAVLAAHEADARLRPAHRRRSRPGRKCCCRSLATTIADEPSISPPYRSERCRCSPSDPASRACASRRMPLRPRGSPRPERG